MTDVAALAEGLSEAQRRALLGAPSTPLGNTWLTCGGSTKHALIMREMASGYGEWCCLTPLGLAVRRLIQEREGR